VKRTSIVAIDHISVPVKDIKTARAFYKAALGAIGMNINMDFRTSFGMGSKKENVFWLTKDAKASGRGHYALRVENREEVDGFFQAALRAGGKDNGAPGPRPDYGRNYYAAFVKDSEGNNLEVVCYAEAGKATRPARASKSSKPAKGRK
jgi:predicted lactoylglutathione lyase